MYQEPWWHPRDIRFTREQVEWLLSWLPSLKEGNWPARPSGYTEAPAGRKARSRHASFETPAQIAAELECRLAKCALDRYLVEDSYIDGIDERDLARKLGLDIGDVGRRISSVLKYVSGWNRKTCSLKEWKGHRRESVKITK